MAEPLSRPGITKLIDETLKDNTQQYITAARLRSVVNPIVDSTYGMKTIWAGSLAWQATLISNFDNNDNIDYVTVTEAYYDPNWFPDASDYSADVSRYVIRDEGLNIVADNGTGTGTITNVPTNSTSFSPVSALGKGARFNLTIINGKCTGITIANPGTGYSFSYTKTPYVYIGDDIFPIVNFTSGGRVPRIEFSTYSAVWPATTRHAFSDNVGRVDYTWNVYSPGLESRIPVPTTAYKDSNVIQINCIDRTGIDTPTLGPITGGFIIDRPFTVSGARSQQTYTWYAAGEGPAEYIQGFFFKQWNRRSETTNIIKCKADIEIRVPIINPTPVII